MGVQRGIMRRWMWVALFACVSLAYSEDLRNVAHDIRFENETLRSVLKSISEKYDVDIIFADAIVRDIIVNCSLEGATIDEVLREVLSKTQLDFRQKDGRQVVISKIPTALSIQLHGEVFDFASGKALESANVQILNTCRGAVSDVGGIFVFNDLPVDDYTLQVSYIGYRDQIVHVAANRQPGKLRIELIAEPIPVEAVRTTPEPSKIQVAAARPSVLELSEATIKALPGADATDAFEGLQTLPGISHSRDGMSNLVIRGSNPSHTMLRLDGMPILRFGRVYGLLSTVDSHLFKDMHIYKGNLPADLSGVLGGIVDVETRDVSQNELRIGARVNPYFYSATIELPFTRNVSLMLNGRNSYPLYLLGRIDKQFILPFSFRFPTEFEPPSAVSNLRPSIRIDRPGYKFKFHDLFAKLQWQPSEENLVQLSAIRTSDDFTNGYDFRLDFLNRDTGIPDANYVYNQMTTHDWQFSGLSGLWRSQLKSDLAMRLSGSLTSYRSENAVVTRSISEDRHLGNRDFVQALYDNLVGTLALYWQANTQTMLSGGIEVNRIHLKNDGRFNHSVLDGAPQNMTEQVSYVANYDKRLNVNQYTAFLSSNWTMMEQLIVEGGVRLTRYNQARLPKSEYYFEPRLDAEYQFSPAFQLKGSWGYQRQILNRVDANAWNEGIHGQDLWAVAGVNGNDAGLNQQVMLGAQWRNSGWLLDLELYRKNITGLTAYNYSITEDDRIGLAFTADSRGENVRTGNGKSIGLDLLLQRSFAALHGYLNYSYNRLRIETMVDELIGQYDYPHQIHIGGQYFLGSIHFKANWFWHSGSPVQSSELLEPPLIQENPYGDLQNALPYNARLAANHQLNIGLERKFEHKKFSGTFGLTVDNVYHRDNVISQQSSIDVRQIGNGEAAPSAIAEQTANVSSRGTRALVSLSLDIRQPVRPER